MAVIWNTPIGNLGLLNERELVDLALDAVSPAGPVNMSLLAGNLPRGLRLIGNSIKGSPVEVRTFTKSRFVIRASDGIDIEDRTFFISVDGSDEPIWVTREGFLKVGPGEAYFVLDNAYVNFALEAIDTDITAGDKLEFYLQPQGGELPPGLVLSKDGVISGFTDPIFSVEYANTISGAYDTASYDTSPLDVLRNDSNGFDSFLYDTTTFDYSEESRAPRKLSRYYTFAVAVSDGIYTKTRIFKIYVVTEEFLKSDNNIVQVDTNLFQADASSFRLPLWITESNLGQYRANNYITVFLDVFDPPTLSGVITYFLLPTNPGTYRINETGSIITNGRYEISGQFPIDPIRPNIFITDTDDWTVVIPETISSVPQGMNLDGVTGEIAGRVPYQSRVTENYQFTVLAVNFDSGFLSANYNWRGNWTTGVIYLTNDAVIYNSIVYICKTNHDSRLPTNINFWLPGVASAEKTFSINIVGEIESGIEWISTSDRGTIKPNQPSKIFVEANSLLYGQKVVYEFVSGSLPPGLSFLPNGLIEGKVKQFGDVNGPGLTRVYDKYIMVTDIQGQFDEGDTIIGSISGSTAEIIYLDSNTNKLYFNDLGSPAMFVQDDIISNGSATATVNSQLKEFEILFDGGSVTFDKKFSFSIRARDTARSTERIRDFFITVIAENNKVFSNLYVVALQDKAKRLEWFNFITDTSIFRQEDIYRYGDPNFGVQTELKMLVYAGIESREAVKFVQAMSRNHYRKRLLFGDPKLAVAKDPFTQEELYEAVYIEIIDELEKNGKSISRVVNLPENTASRVLVSYDAIRVDSDIPFASDRDHQRVFPNSIKNMRKRISDVGERDREFLPLWMRSIQDAQAYEPGYTKSLLLCYVKPGKGSLIISRIKAKTQFADRGRWNNGDFYQINESVEYQGSFYTSILNSTNVNPENPNFWAKNFDFKSIDFESDRYRIDSIDGEILDKYLAFPQRDVLNKLANPSKEVVNTIPTVVGSFDSDEATFDSDALTFDQG